MHKVSTLFLLFLFLARGNDAAAQSDMRPGYIIPVAGDTVRGEVAVLGTQRSFRQCQFRPAAATEMVTYQPQQLAGYGIPGLKEYRTGLVSVTDTVQALRFMEVLVQGQATLLMSSDNDNDPHFFLQRQPTAVPEELRLIVRDVRTNGRIYKQEIKQYQQVLLSAFADQPGLASRIRQTRFSMPDLVSLFQRYNAESSVPVRVGAAAMARSKYRLGLVAGASLGGSMRLKSASNVPAFYNTSVSKPTSPIFGAQVAMNPSRLGQKLWFQLGVLYHRRNYNGRVSRNTQVTSTLDDYYVVHYDATFVQLPLVLRFEGNKGRIRPLLEAGVGSNFRLSEGQNAYTIYYTNQQAPVSRVFFQNARIYEQSLLAGAGLTSAMLGGHHASLLVRYELGNGVSPYSGTSSACSTVMVLLNYDLFGK